MSNCTGPKIRLDSQQQQESFGASLAAVLAIEAVAAMEDVTMFKTGVGAPIATPEVVVIQARRDSPDPSSRGMGAPR